MVLQALDERHGSWVSSGASTPLGTDGGATHHEGGSSVDTAKPQYRFATGEGLVVAQLRGEVLYDGRRLFHILGEDQSYDLPGHSEGASSVQESRRRGMKAGLTIASVASVALTGGAIAWTVNTARARHDITAPLLASLVSTASTVAFATAASHAARGWRPAPGSPRSQP